MPAPFVLIAFSFPPYNRIGAYRWSKLTGKLARRGHAVDVVTVDWPAAADPGWFGDVEHENITVHRTPSLYPHRLRAQKPRARLLQKLQARAFRTLDRLAPAHDVAALWGPAFAPVVARLCARPGGPRVVIATGAPFSANYWAARSKALWSGAALIQDFRDPWLLSHEETRSSPWARRFRVATGAADVLVSVTPEMTTLYQRTSGHPRAVTVPNGVELAQIRQACRAGAPRLDFAYIGNLFNQREEPFGRFLDWTRQKQREGRALRVAVAGVYPNHLRDRHGDLIASGALELHPQLPQRAAFELLSSSRVALHFTGPGALGTYQTTTKLVEHAALGVPTLSLNYGGASEAFIRARHLGWSVRADGAELFEELDRCGFEGSSFDFDVAEFDFENTAARYSQLIDELASSARS